MFKTIVWLLAGLCIGIMSGYAISRMITRHPSITVPIQRTKTAIPFGIASGGDLPNMNKADLDRYFKNLSELGVNWVRFDIEWGKIQPVNANKFQWAGTDRVVSMAEKYHMLILGTLAYAPQWARNGSCADRFNCEPKSAQEFGIFAGRAAARYKTSVTSWEIWNEPNYSLFWAPKPDVRIYADMLKYAYVNIKQVNPDAVVLSGGLAPSDNADGNISPVAFMQQLYELGYNKYFDGIALHPYTYPMSIDSILPANNWKQLATIRSIAAVSGDGNKKIWITEFGAPTGGPGRSREINTIFFSHGSDYMSENAQEEIMKQATSYVETNQDWMGPFFWYSLRDKATDTESTENFFGLVRFDWSPKPAFAEFRNIIAP